jgi:hypothetical protein
MKYPVNSAFGFPRSGGPNKVRSASTDWVETHIEYLRSRDEWDYRRVVAQASFSDDQDAWRDETNLDALVLDLADSVRVEAEACGVTFRLEVAQDLALVRLNSVALRDVLLEMVHDALHGLALGQVEARELVARIELTPAHQIEIRIGLRR